MDIVLSMTRPYLDRIVALNLPSAILGIGTQVEFGSRGTATSESPKGEALQLHPMQIELLAAVALGCSTPRCCYGGNSSPSPPLRLAFTMPASVSQRSSHAKLLERMFVDAGRRFPNFIIVLQSRFDIVWVARLRRSLTILDSQVRLFYSVPAWLAMLRSRDLLIGARIHGTMAATAAELPTITVATDYRIKELAERMLLPMVHLHKMGEPTIIDTLVRRHARFSGGEFDANRRPRRGSTTRCLAP